MATSSIGKVVRLDDAARKRLLNVLSSPRVLTTTVDGSVEYASGLAYHDAVSRLYEKQCDVSHPTPKGGGFPAQEI